MFCREPHLDQDNNRIITSNKKSYPKIRLSPFVSNIICTQQMNDKIAMK